MGRIIISAEYIDEGQNSTGYFWSKIIAGLKTDGFDVVVLHPQSLNNYDLFEGSPSIFRRLFKQFIISFDLAVQIFHTAMRKDTVFTGTNPAILLCVMPVLKKILGVKWVLLVHDVFPDNLVAARIISKRSLLFKLAIYYFSWVYSSPDKLLCIGRDMQSFLRKKTSGRAKTIFISNWANGKDVYPLARINMSFLTEVGWDRYVVFQFFGNIGRVQGIDNLLQAISLVTAKNAAFIFIGGGVMVPSVEKFIKDNPEKNIKFLGPIPLEQKNVGLALCDVALISLEAGMLGLGVPSKCYFSLAAGKPILATVDAESEIGLMLEEFPVGWRCDPNSPEQLANLVDNICASPKQVNEKKPREVFLQNYSEEIVLKKISNVLSDVIYCTH